MSRNIYGPVNDARKEVEHIYGPVNGARKKVIKVYGSVNGARKLMWQEIPVLEVVSGGPAEIIDPEGLTSLFQQLYGGDLPGGTIVGHYFYGTPPHPDDLPRPHEMFIDSTTQSFVPKKYWPVNTSTYISYPSHTVLKISWAR